MPNVDLYLHSLLISVLVIDTCKFAISSGSEFLSAQSVKKAFFYYFVFKTN